jgi:hypothetical protein
VTNNIAESFNNWIKDIKDLPVCKLADKIREKIMELEGKILPAVMQVQKART